MEDKIKQLADDYAAVLKEAKSIGCNEIRALYNIPLENMELIVQALETIKKLSDRKMTTEVLENYMQFEDECVKKGFTFKSVIEAREKQIPRKPILKNGETGSFVDYENGHGEYRVTKWQDWVCPICGWFVGQRYNRSQNHSHDQRKCNYCNECGQKIDWSDNA